MAGTAPYYPTSTAVVSWVDTSGQAHLRVYSSDGYTVTERCDDGSGWVTGQFKQPGAQVSATGWAASGGVAIRVYCTLDDTTTEWCVDASSADWYQGSYTPQ